MTYFPMPVIRSDFALKFARSWIEAWNHHDLDAVLNHYADDVEFASPLIASIAGEASGMLVGKTNVKAYWQKALQQISDLHFDLREVLIGVDSITLYYQGPKGMATELLLFDHTKKVKKAWACYAIRTTQECEP